MNYLKALKSLKGASGYGILLLLAANYFGFDLTFEDAGILADELAKLANNGVGSALVFMAGVLIEKGKTQKEQA